MAGHYPPCSFTKGPFTANLLLLHTQRLEATRWTWTVRLCGTEVLPLGVKRCWTTVINCFWFLIVTSSTIDIFFEITKFSKILSKFTFISNILSKFDKFFEIFRKKGQLRKYFRKFCNFKKSVMVDEVNIIVFYSWNHKEDLSFCSSHI